jgi:hypothetical protein
VDPVADNHRRTVTYAVERAIPDSLSISGPIQEFVESQPGAQPFRHRYEAPFTTRPSGSTWAVREVILQTQNRRGAPVEVLPARIVEGTRLVSSSILWDGDEEIRDSVAQATIAVTYEDCAGERRALQLNNLAVILAPR